jgi:DNA-binding response OmpR family regulator
MKVESGTRYAVVVEPHHALAEGVANCLRKRGYVVGIAGTHASGAAWAATRAQIDLLVASVPAPTESLEAAYLAEARGGQRKIGMIIMLSNQDEPVGEVPRHAIRIGKPFSLLELEAAIDQAVSGMESLDVS